jgi:hypothetical protein
MDVVRKQVAEAAAKQGAAAGEADEGDGDDELV